jgi:elongator complex protein 5
LYHTDVPVQQSNPYGPSPLQLLKVLATTILTVHSLDHILAQKAARDRSVAEPSFGLDEGIEGVIVGFGSNSLESVIEMDYRRTSGRHLKEWYVVNHQNTTDIKKPPPEPGKPAAKGNSAVILLEDHPKYPRSGSLSSPGAEEDLPDSTFNLALTDKQRQDRDAVVLPYFDAQKDGGVGDGGRILYEMGAEDDFDDEEDEI